MDVVNPDKVGWLTKQGGLVKSWKKRWFVLKNNKLSYYRGKTDSEAAGVIGLTGAKVQNGDKKASKKHCIEIITDGRTYYVHADSQSDYEDWIKALQKSAVVPSLSPPTIVNTISNDAFASQSNLLQLINSANTTSDGSITIFVRGMHCEKCVAQMHTTLKRNRNIKSYEIDIDKETVVVTEQQHCFYTKGSLIAILTQQIGKTDINELLGSIEQHGFIANV